MTENVALVRSLYEAFAQGDIPTVLAAMHPQIAWHEAENSPYDDGGPAVGPEEVLNKVFMRLGSEWEGFTPHVEEIIGAGDQVVVLGRYGGVYKATGKELHAQFAHVYRLEDGKVTRFDQYTDTLQYAEVTQQRDREIRKPAPA